MSNLQGVRFVQLGKRYRVFHRVSQCYWGRYRKGASPRYAQALSGRTKLWARTRPYNRRRKPLKGGTNARQ